MRLIDADELRKQLDEGVWNDAVAEVDAMPTIEALSVVYGEGIPTLTEKEKQEPQLIIKERGMEFHFSYGELLMVLP